MFKYKNNFLQKALICDWKNIIVTCLRYYSNPSILPELDLSYLCNKNNYEEISKNIISRKGIGNIQRVVDLKTKLDNTDATHKNYDSLRTEFYNELFRIPNKTHPDVARLQEEPKVVKLIGTKKVFDFEVREFFDITKRLNLVRTEQLGNVSGSRSYFVLGEMAELEQALANYTVDRLRNHNFNFISVPDILNRNIIDGCGLNTRGNRTQMVRKYQRTPGTRTYRDYTDDKLNEAIQKIADNELSIKAASLHYKIPYGTLHNKYHGKHVRKTGGQPVFTNLEERAILNSALKCADWGFPLDLLEIRMLAKKYLDGKGRKVDNFQNNLPGKDWALSLLDRHKDQASQRISGNINKARAKVSRETLTTYFNNLEETLDNVAPSNIFNYDETNVGDNPGSRKLVYRRGVKYPENIVNHSKSCTSIMICGSADGILLPPYVIYKSEHLYNTWKEGGISGYPCCTKPCCAQGCRFSRTSHGWMDAVTFEDWFCSSFLPHAKRLEGKKVLIGDNLSFHFNERVLALCEENDISFVCLVPHSTHICQPLDVAFFKPFKVAWRNILTTYKLRHHTSGIAKEVFPGLLKSAIEKMNAVQAQTKDKPGDQETGVKRNLINGFYATGIYPFNAHKVLNKIPDIAHNPEQEMNDTLTELLREKRYGTNNTVERVRRKKQRLNIIPGKSVATRNSSEEEEDSEREEETAVVEEEESGEENVETEVDYAAPTKNLLKPEAFVLVKFVSGRRKSTTFQYVCKILTHFSENEFNIVGLKSTNAEKTTFKLVENDVSTVPDTDIIAVLPTPVELGEKEYEFPAKVDVKEL